MRNVSLEQNSSLDLDIGNVSSIFCRSKLFCQLVQLECLYLDKTSLKLLTLPPPPRQHPQGVLLAHPLLLFFIKAERL